MFASLGFKVDTSGLVGFKASLSQARSELKNFSQNGKNSSRQMRNLRREVDKLSTSMGKIRGATGNNKVSQGYSNIAGSVHKLNNALNAITTNRASITKAIGKINSSVLAGAPHWERYRDSVVRTRMALRNLNGDLRRLRANSRVDIRVRNADGGGSGGSGRGSRGGAGGLGGAVAGFGLRGFLGNMIPTMALSGVGAGVGYGGVQMVKAARDQTSMESMILMVSDSAEEFKNTIDYISTEGLRLGLNSAELGKSFAQISMSAENLSNSDKKEMFTGFSEFMMAMGTSDEDQKGIFRAFNQMFSNNRILMEEVNQLSDRGIPATLIYDAAKEAYGIDSTAQIKKIQEDGKLDPSKVLTVMAKTLQEKAHSSGAFEKMQNSSMFKQNQFKSQLRQTSKVVMDMGLDRMLGDIFGILGSIVTELRSVATAIEGISLSVKGMKETIDGFTGGNGGKILTILSLMIFRWRGLAKGASRAFAVLRNGGKTTRALAEFMKGALGKTLTGLIKRFGGLVAVIWTAWEAMVQLGKIFEQKKMGNWTVFDTISIYAENAVLKVKVLIEELKWLKAYMTSGAMVDEGFGEFSGMVGRKAGQYGRGAKDFLSQDFNLGGAFNWGSDVGKAWNEWLTNKEKMKPTGTPSLNGMGSIAPKEFVFNFYDKGKLVRSERAAIPSTFPQ